MIRFELFDIQNLNLNESGVYILCNSDDLPIYVGRSYNLRERLKFKRINKLYAPFGITHAYIIFADQILSPIPRKIEYVEIILIDFLSPKLNKKYYPNQARRYKDLNLYF